jgi:hypothetical protein
MGLKNLFSLDRYLVYTGSNYNRNELSLSTTSRTVITVSPIFSYELSIIVPYLEIIITIELQIKNAFLKD